MKITELEEQLRVALARIAELEGTPPDVPPFVKANTNPRPTKKERHKRTTNHVRKHQPPSVTEQHALDHCPDCAYRLMGQSSRRRRAALVAYLRTTLRLRVRRV